MIGQKVSGYLNLWILDSTICMALVMILKHFLVMTILLFMKSNLKRTIGRMAANLTITMLYQIVRIILDLRQQYRDENRQPRFPLSRSLSI